jgi:hypothetical protein
MVQLGGCNDGSIDRGNRLDWSAVNPGRVWIDIGREVAGTFPTVSAHEYIGGGVPGCEQRVERRDSVGRSQRRMDVHRAIHFVAAP